LLIAIFLLFIFLFDSIFTIIRRLRNKENIFKAHRSHLYQRLNILGQEHDQISVLYLLLALAGLTAAIILYLLPSEISALESIILILICGGLWYYVILQESVGVSTQSERAKPEFDPTSDTILAHLSSPTGVLPRNRYFFLLDVFSLAIIPWFALSFRLDQFPIASRYWVLLLGYTIVGMTIRLTIFYAFGLYRHYWRYAGIDELAQIISTVTLTTIIIAPIYWVARWFMLEPNSLIALPRSLPLMDGALTLIAIGGSRYAMRLVSHRRSIITSGSNRQVLVVGAGNAGAMIVREIQKNPRFGMFIVGFLDDDPAKHNLKIQGVPVLGNRHDIAKIAATHKISQLIIAMPSAPGHIIREITNISESIGIKAKIVPSLHQLLTGDIKVNQLRDVAIEDLLRRTPVTTDERVINNLLHGKRVLVTGGGGSIGSELCRQIWRSKPTQLILLGHGENSIFDIHNELSRLNAANGKTKISAVIADTRFPKRIQAIFEQYKPEIVFHAAAHKHVPLMESNAVEAITTNVFGTQNVLNASLTTGVEHFV
ncbi:MAG TPA: NAD-dependent epimerase/dehydratase family protein, partial [Anaerolineae bacterium]|nr:NAD-dependent epimerase/dehydratase family protein [Anaerolineae bacterium]